MIFTASGIHRQRGLSMIEVLVTLVILLLGLLGLAGMMMQSQRSTIESYQRAQALILLQDMAARINTNRGAAGCYAITTDAANGAPFLGVESTVTAPTCTTGTAAQQALAIQDLIDWSTLLKGEMELSAENNKIGAMDGARGCITYDATSQVYQVTVAWQGLSATSAPADAWACGKGQYGDDDKMRRVVGLTLRIS